MAFQGVLVCGSAPSRKKPGDRLIRLSFLVAFYKEGEGRQGLPNTICYELFWY
jgi:hypothetical protein